MQDQPDRAPAGWERSKSLVSELMSIMVKAYKDWGGFGSNSDQSDNRENGVDEDDGPREK